MKSEFRPPAAIAGPVGFHSLLVYLMPPSYIYFTVLRAPEVLRIRILDASGPRSSKHDANYSLRELRTATWTPLDTDPQYIMQIMLLGAQDWNAEHSRPILLRILLQAIDQFD